MPNDFAHPYTYTGRRLDPETGLYYYRNRYYHAQLGRFVNRDPIGYEGGWNLYGYVSSNPMILTDPYGLVAPNPFAPELPPPLPPRKPPTVWDEIMLGADLCIGMGVGIRGCVGGGRLSCAIAARAAERTKGIFTRFWPRRRPWLHGTDSSQTITTLGADVAENAGRTLSAQKGLYFTQNVDEAAGYADDAVDIMVGREPQILKLNPKKECLLRKTGGVIDDHRIIPYGDFSKLGPDDFDLLK